MEDFKKFMQNSGMGERTLKDHISRCRRIEREFNVILAEEALDVKRYIRLVKIIRKAYRANKNSKFAAGAVAAQLVASFRKYAEFKVGKKTLNRYPMARGGFFERITASR
jgi:hypothetical protein